MDLKHIKAIIFDAEGVVVDTEALWDKSQDVLLGRRNLEYDRDYLKPRMAGQTLLQGAELMVDYYKLSENPHHIAQERHVLIHELFENEIAFIPGFTAFIDHLNRSDLKRSVATAMKKSLMVMVEQKLQLKQVFAKVFPILWVIRCFCDGGLIQIDGAISEFSATHQFGESTQCCRIVVSIRDQSFPDRCGFGLPFRK